MYDTIIIGCGPSGISCAIYLKRAGKNVLILEKSMVGGQIAVTKSVDNYPGIKSIDGASLAMQMYDHAISMGVEIKFEEVISCDLKAEHKVVNTHKNIYTAKTIFIGTGASTRQLNVNGEKRLFGKGISYCATCDGALYKNKDVAIVGAGNTALEDCVYLSNIANKVYLIHRRDEFRGDFVNSQNIFKQQENGKIELVLSSEIVDIIGEEKLEKVIVKNKKTEKLSELSVSALFVAIGRKPDTEIFDGIELTEKGYIKTNEKMQTNIQGVYAGGDVRDTPLRQIVTACSDGALASVYINEYINTNFKK